MDFAINFGRVSENPSLIMTHTYELIMTDVSDVLILTTSLLLGT